MNYDTYIDLIANNKLKEATQYKSSCIPNILYKYYWLDNDEEKNEKKFNTLEAGKVYMSSLKDFNDPFEGNAFFFDEQELRDKEWDPKLFENFIEHINSNTGIGCFCNEDEKEQNMPMWAYYANNHFGFCVEYMIDDKIKKFMYPVSYDDTRAPGNAIVGNIIDQTLELIKLEKNEDDMSGKLMSLNHLAYLSLTSKHKSWKHEKEVRALVPRKYGNYLEILPKKIFIGMNCTEVHRKRLIEIAKNFQPYCDIFQMGKISKNSKHWLSEEKVNITCQTTGTMN